MTPIIIPTLTGGLGNRIFQVLAALGYAEKVGGRVCFHEKLWRDNPHDDPNHILKLFPTISFHPVIYNHVYVRDTIWPPPKHSNDIVILSGYFQQEQWFPSTIPITLPSYPEYNLYPFLHIRRGDYLTLLHHYVPLEEYYKKALSFFPEDQPIVVFSDDMEWCKRELPNQYPERKWIWAPSGSDYEILAMMASCKKGAICANSTFSWLGAFFGARKEANPCYFPSQWFADNRQTTIYPSWGTILPVGGLRT